MGNYKELDDVFALLERYKGDLARAKPIDIENAIQQVSY